ncbi:hypothetical protein [Nissabacter archeti]|uniref:hypothetical protein n=1 Tax=Nissabacter archeti TaxID=1917880 RepID=UPI00111528E5|nr:hypothetical protein [Nissabacter archeti]
MQTQNVNVKTAASESRETKGNPQTQPAPAMRDANFFLTPDSEMTVARFLRLYECVTRHGHTTSEPFDDPGCERLILMSNYCPDTYVLFFKKGCAIAASDELAMTTWIMS